MVTSEGPTSGHGVHGSDAAWFMRQTQRRMSQWWLRLGWWLLPLFLALGVYRQLLFLMNPGVVLHKYQQGAFYELLQSSYGAVSALSYLLPLLVWLLAVRRAEKISTHMLEECAAPRLQFGPAWRFRLLALQGLPVMLALLLFGLISAYPSLLSRSQCAGWLPGQLEMEQIAAMLSLHSGAVYSESILGLLLCWVAALLRGGKVLWLAALGLRAATFIIRLLPEPGRQDWSAPEWPLIGACLLGAAGVALAVYSISRGRAARGLGLLLFIQLDGLLSLFAWRLCSSYSTLPDWFKGAILMFFSLDNWVGFLAPSYQPHWNSRTQTLAAEPSVFISPFLSSGFELGAWAIYPVLLGRLALLFFFYRLLHWLAGRATRTGATQASQLASDNETTLESSAGPDRSGGPISA